MGGGDDPPNQMPFGRGEELGILDDETYEQWWEAQNKAGRVGLIPYNYVERIETPDIAASSTGASVDAGAVDTSAVAEELSLAERQRRLTASLPVTMGGNKAASVRPDPTVAKPLTHLTRNRVARPSRRRPRGSAGGGRGGGGDSATAEANAKLNAELAALRNENAAIRVRENTCAGGGCFCVVEFFWFFFFFWIHGNRID